MAIIIKIACMTVICKAGQVEKGMLLIFSMKLFIIYIDHASITPVIPAIAGRKAVMQSNISPNKMPLDRGTAIKLVIINKFGNWWK